MIKPIIKELRTEVLRLPIKESIADATHTLPCLDFIYLTVTTQEGLQGHSYMLSFDYGTEIMQALLDKEIARHVVGEEVLQIEHIWQKLWAEFEYFGNVGLGMWGIAALDIALWDLKSKYYNMPLQVLLGGCHKALPVYGSGGWLSYSLETLFEEVLTYKKRGFKGAKIKVGHPDPLVDVARVRAVREALGEELDLMVDANQGWYLDQALKFARSVEDLNITWFEEPLRLDDKKNLKLLREKIDIPIAIGEREYGLTPFRDICLLECADILQPDVIRVGGITKYLQVGKLAEAFNIRVASHFYKETDVFILSALPNAKYLEYFGWFDELFINPLKIEAGMVLVPEEPGMRLEIKPEARKEYLLK